MREEVGRTIGLSARKVQIWFQNQRQKARRPRSQSASRPLQYGPFLGPPPGSAPHVAAVLSPFADASGSNPPGGLVRTERVNSPTTINTDDHASSIAGTYPAYFDPTPRLVGPGMPGSGPSSASAYSSTRGAPPAASSYRLFSPPPTAPHPVLANSESHVRVSPSPPSTHVRSPHIDFDRVTPMRYGDRDREMHSFRTLPPLSWPLHLSASTQSGAPFPSPKSSSSAVSYFERASPREAGYQYPTSPSQPTQGLTQRSPVILPPPFTLQPEPLWDIASLSPLSRARRQPSWDRPRTAYRRLSGTSSALAEYEAAAYDRIRRSHHGEDEAHLTTRPDATAPPHRFDPIRSATESERGYQPREGTSPSSSGSRSVAEPMNDYPERRPAFLLRRNSDALATIR